MAQPQPPIVHHHSLRLSLSHPPAAPDFRRQAAMLGDASWVRQGQPSELTTPNDTREPTPDQSGCMSLPPPAIWCVCAVPPLQSLHVLRRTAPGWDARATSGPSMWAVRGGVPPLTFFSAARSHAGSAAPAVDLPLHGDDGNDSCHAARVATPSSSMLLRQGPIAPREIVMHAGTGQISQPAVGRVPVGGRR